MKMIIADADEAFGKSDESVLDAMREYALDLLGGDRYWAATHGKTELAAIYARLSDEVAALDDDESFVRLDRAFGASDFETLTPILNEVHGHVGPHTSATDYLKMLAAAHHKSATLVIH
jgi:hypothetical protein